MRIASLGPGRSSESVASAVTDKVWLGQSEPSLDLIPAAKREAVTQLLALEKQLLAEPTPNHQQLAQAAASAGQVGKSSTDPLVKRLADRICRQAARHLPEPEPEPSTKIDPLAAFDKMCRRLDWGSTDRIDEGVLDRLPATPATLRKVIDAAGEMYRKHRRESNKDQPDVAKLKDHAFNAEGFAWRLTGWWHHGELKVRREGEILKPGAVDLDVILGESRVGLYGDVIEIPPVPRRRDPEVVKMAGEIAAKSESSRFAIFEDTLEAHPEKGPELISTLIEDAEAGRDGEARFMTWLLGQVRGDRPVRGLLKPHLERMRTLTRRARAEGRVPEKEEVKYYGRFLSVFPEQLDRELFTEELMPLVKEPDGSPNNGGFELVKRALEARPDFADQELVDQELGPLLERAPWAASDLGRLLMAKNSRLVGPVAHMFMERSRRVEATCHEGCTLNDAIRDFGWVPDRDQLGFMVSELYFPTTQLGEQGLEKVSFFKGPDNSRTHSHTVNLGHLERNHPGLLDGLVLPTPGGSLAPVGTALVERLLVEPGDELFRKLHGGEDFWRDLVEPVCQLASKDTGLRTRLLETALSGLRQAAQGKKLKVFTAEQQGALGLVRLMNLEGEERARFAEALEPFSFESHSGAFTHLMRSHCRERAQEYLEVFKAPGISPEERLEGAVQALAYTATQMQTAPEDEEVLKEIAAGAAAHPEFAAALENRLSDGLERVPLNSYQGRARLRLFAHLANQTSNDTLAEKLRGAIGRNPRTIDKELLKVGKTLVRKDLERLRQPALLSIIERVALVEGVDRLQGEVSKDARSAFKRGLEPQPEYERFMTSVKERFGLNEAFEMVAFLVRSGAENQAQLRTGAEELHSLVELTDDLETGRNLYQQIQVLVSSGVDRTQARERALEIFAAGARFEDAMTGPGGEPDILIHEDHVEVGSFSLEVR